MKKWYQSKIIWVNVISIILEVLNVLMASPIIPIQYAGLMTVIVNVITIVLRFISSGAIGRGSIWVVKDENTGLYLVGYTETPLTPSWGALSAALEFDEVPAKVLAGRIGGGVVGTPKIPK